MGDTSIEWSDKTWNPIRARNRVTGEVGWFCEHVSRGCDNCYADKMNQNTYFGNGLPYKATALPELDLFLDEKMIEQPLRWRTPKKVFVCSMTDLFGRFVPDDFILEIFRIMETAGRHTFQILTKRPERMLEFVGHRNRTNPHRCPAPNVWLGVSVENQETADERIPLLLQTPAAKRFISYEPALGPLDLCGIGGCCSEHQDSQLDWVIVGGESGYQAREFDIAWAQSMVEQCQESGIACFVKQLGSQVRGPHENGVNVTTLRLAHKKGGDISEWPAGLRVREFPESKAVAV